MADIRIVWQNLEVNFIYVLISNSILIITHFEKHQISNSKEITFFEIDSQKLQH